jgi:virginiamycin B lyase
MRLRAATTWSRFRKPIARPQVEGLESRRLLSAGIQEYPLPEGSSGQGIVEGPDGNLWFTDISGNIGEINPTTHEPMLFPIPTARSGPGDITEGSDGNLWFTEGASNKIGLINAYTHTFAELTIPTANSDPVGITVGPDGNFWFTEQNAFQLGEINLVTHAISEFKIPRFGAGPSHITLGPDGNIWFIEQDSKYIGFIDPTEGGVTEFPVPGYSAPYSGIAAGPDDNLWFTSATYNEIVRINPATHAMKEFPIPTAGSKPQGISAGSDGNLWFTEEDGDNIGRITTTGDITEYPIQAPDFPQEITRGPDGNLWFTELGIVNSSNYQINSNIGEVVLGEGDPDLALSGTALSSVAPGSNVTYSLTVTNNGSATAAGVELIDTLPAGATFVSATGEIFPNINHDLVFTIGNLAAGASTATISIEVTPGAPGNYTDSASVSMDQTDPTPDDNSVTLTTNVMSVTADVKLSGAGPGRATFGSDVTYTFMVSNDGGADATGVKLTDILPVGAAFKSSSGALEQTFAGYLIFYLGTLAPGASTTVTVVLTAPTDTSQTPLVNDASVSMDQTDPSPPDNSVSLSTTLVGTKGTGCQGRRTVVLLRFAQPVDPAWAKNVHNYQLVDRERSPRTIRLRSARFNAATNTVTLKPLHQPNMHDLFQLTVLSDGAHRRADAVTSPTGGRNGSGGPGGNLVIMIGIQDLLTRGTSPTSLRNFKWILARQTLVMKRLGLE